MFSVLKPVIRFIARNAPWGAREALLQGLCDRDPISVLSHVARTSGFEAVLADGDCGFIQGSCDDRILLPSYAHSKTWAPATIRFFQDFFSGRSGTYLDIGANIGLTTIPIARNSRVRCIAFEPEPVNFRHLFDNVRRNSQHGNVQLVQGAVTDRSGTIRLGLNEAGHHGDHRVVAGPSTSRVIEVQSVALDDYLDRVEGAVAAKIDTQGAEPLVVAGGRQVLSRVEALVMEYWPYGISQLGGPPANVYAFLRQFPRLAIVRGDSNSKLDFLPSAEQIRRLESDFAAATLDRWSYFDVYAIR